MRIFASSPIGLKGASTIVRAAAPCPSARDSGLRARDPTHPSGLMPISAQTSEDLILMRNLA
jgi:hypothetical protein